MHRIIVHGFAEYIKNLGRELELLHLIDRILVCTERFHAVHIVTHDLRDLIAHILDRRSIEIRIGQQMRKTQKRCQIVADLYIPHMVR